MQSEQGNLTQGGPAGDSGTSTISDSDVQVLKEDHKEFMVFRTEVFQDLSVSSCCPHLGFLLLNSAVCSEPGEILCAQHCSYAYMSEYMHTHCLCCSAASSVTAVGM